MYLADKDSFYEVLGVAQKDFKKTFGVDEADFFDMLQYVSQQYNAAKHRNANEDKAYRIQQNTIALRSAVQDMVGRSGADRDQQQQLRSKLCKILGRAGGNATYLRWLQPQLPLIHQ